MLTDAPGRSGGVPNGVNPTNLFIWNGLLLFSALWTSDGTVAGTTQVPNFAANGPLGFFEMNGVVYFSGTDSHGREFWRLDQTAGP